MSEVKAVLPLTLYTLGIAFGPILLAPLSETFGRLWLYRISFTMLLAFLAGAGAAQSFATLLVCRFLASFLGSPALAMGAGTIADLWHLGRAGGLAGSMFILVSLSTFKGTKLRLMLIGTIPGPNDGATSWSVHHVRSKWRLALDPVANLPGRCSHLGFDMDNARDVHIQTTRTTWDATF